MTLGLRVNEENLYNEILKKGLKLIDREDLNYKEYLITIKIYNPIMEDVFKYNVIELIGTHDTFSELCFEKKYIYFTKDEVIKMVKKEIDDILNKKFYS